MSRLLRPFVILERILEAWSMSSSGLQTGPAFLVLPMPWVLWEGGLTPQALLAPRVGGSVAH